MNTKTAQAEVREAYADRHAEALDLLDEIRERLSGSSDPRYAPDSRNWGHVGDITATVVELRDIRDTLTTRVFISRG